MKNLLLEANSFIYYTLTLVTKFFIAYRIMIFSNVKQLQMNKSQLIFDSATQVKI